MVTAENVSWSLSHAEVRPTNARLFARNLVLAVHLPFAVFAVMLIPAQGLIVGVLAAALVAGAAVLFRKLLAWHAGPIDAHEVLVDGTAIVLDGRESLTISLGEVRWGAAGGTLVRLALHRGYLVDAVMDDPGDARAVIEAAKLDARNATMRLPLRGAVGTPVRAGVMGLALCFVAVPVYASAVPNPGAAGWLGLLATLVTCFAVGWTVAQLIAPHLVVGNDGLMIRYGLRREFLGYENIARIELDSDTAPTRLTLTSPDGRLRTLPTVTWQSTDTLLLVQRVRDAAAGGGSAARREIFARNGESIAQWRARITEMVTAQSFRKQHIADDDAREVMADQSASAEERVGAAIAMLAHDADAAGVVEQAILPVANPHLRGALTALLAEDDDALDAALAVPEKRDELRAL